MLGYYPNSNAKATASNLKRKVQTLVLWTFHKHSYGLTYIDSTIHTNIHKAQRTSIAHTHTQTHLLTNNHTYISTCLHTYIYNFINKKNRSNTCLDININIEKYRKHKYRKILPLKLDPDKIIETYLNNTLTIISEKLG